jgi:integrase
MVEFSKRTYPADNDNAERSEDALETAGERAGLVDLGFRDLRHEAISRFFEKGLNVLEVALISGHRDPRMLFQYAHPRAEIIASKTFLTDKLGLSKC